jgi:hypothetical protein
VVEDETNNRGKPFNRYDNTLRRLAPNQASADLG